MIFAWDLSRVFLENRIGKGQGNRIGREIDFLNSSC
jgi:hypothetical protein